jgi:glycosyltransferase involved in cell wall biosynthesis
MKGYSIIICCYNSSSRIKDTLNHIANLDCPRDYSFEIVLVDNCSNDDTAKLAVQHWNNFNSHFYLKIIHESNPGLSNARVAGILNSKFDYLIFCDDDNWLHKDYLLHVEQSFKNSNCKIVGGIGFPVSDIVLPEWFFEYGQSAYAVGNYGRSEGAGFLSYGAGLAIRRHVALNYEKLNGRLFLSDRKGNSLSSGGDSELCFIVGLDHVFFNPNLKFSHYLGSRVTENHFLKLNRSFGIAEAYLFYYQINSFSWIISLKLILIKLFNSLKLFFLLKFKSKNTLLSKAKVIFHTYLFKTLLLSLINFNSNRNKAAFNINWFKR